MSGLIKTGIQQLSPAQISKLMRHGRVRVKHGAHHHLLLSPEQHKKVMAAHRRGAAHTLEFFPGQAEHHAHLRGGSAKSMARKTRHTFEEIGHVAAPIAKQVGQQLLQQTIKQGLPILIKSALGAGARRGRPRRHSRSGAIPTSHFQHRIMHAMGDGEGVHRRRKTPRRRLTFAMGDGEGVHHRRKTPKRKTPKRRARRGGALMPAGSGVGEYGFPQVDGLDQWQQW